MPQLPQPVSRRRTAARMAKLDELYDRLLKDTRLNDVGAATPAMSERDIWIGYGSRAIALANRL